MLGTLRLTQSWPHPQGTLTWTAACPWPTVLTSLLRTPRAHRPTPTAGSRHPPVLPQPSPPPSTVALLAPHPCPPHGPTLVSAPGGLAQPQDLHPSLPGCAESKYALVSPPDPRLLLRLPAVWPPRRATRRAVYAGLLPPPVTHPLARPQPILLPCQVCCCSFLPRTLPIPSQSSGDPLCPPGLQRQG